MQLSSDRRYRFAAHRRGVWDALAATDEYQRWWPWLRGFDAGGLVAGESWRCVVRPPLPYTLRFMIDLHEVVRPELVTATVAGDITGEARLDFEDDGDGCAIRLTSTLVPGSRTFGVVATLARPLVQCGHDWVLDTGAAQFAAHALRR